MNTVQAIGGVLLSVCIALKVHALEIHESEQSYKRGVSLEIEVENVTVTASDKPGRCVDSSHQFAAGRTIAVTRWVDSFFGDMDGDGEIAESRLRPKIITDWDERLTTETLVSVGGMVNLLRLADHGDLVFCGDVPSRARAQ